MEIKQGDIFWVEIDEPRGSEPGFTRPFVIIQNNVFNRSRINTVLVSALTTNREKEFQFTAIFRIDHDHRNKDSN